MYLMHEFDDRVVETKSVRIGTIQFAEEGSLPDMHFHVASGFFYFFMLVVKSSWSWEASHYVAVTSDTGQLLCGMTPPNKTVSGIGSPQECTASCSHVCPTPCKSLNYHRNARLCDHFYYIPCSYGVQEDCINYQVKIIEFCIESFED